MSTEIFKSLLYEATEIKFRMNVRVSERLHIIREVKLLYV